MSLEKQHLRLGFVPLCDAAPLLVAKDRGFFAEQGLNVELSREASWASIRDKVAVGALDGAQMLAPMPLAATLGLGNMQTRFITALGLNVGGNAITVSNTLYERMCKADPLAMAERPIGARALETVIAAGRAVNARQLTFAVVFPFSPHNYDLRAWMAAAGIDPDHDVRLVVIPPSQMVSNLSAGSIDGYCVGEPWNSLAATLRLGRTLITSQELHGGRVEKVLGVRQDWADQHPHTHKALLKAVLLASAWADKAENRAEVAEIIAQPGRINAPLEIVRSVLADSSLMFFHRYAANFPWRSQALWYLAQMARWGQSAALSDPLRLVDTVFRPDIYRMAALELDMPVPLTDSKSEGFHPGLWTLTEATRPIGMGHDTLFDRSSFDPVSVIDALTNATAPHRDTLAGDQP
jgi:nitrate/nitrite transport system substrate-binding protein